MPLYSFVVWTPIEIQVPEKGLLLDPGTNAFNVLIDDVEGLVARFEASGALIKQQNRLDEYEPVPSIMETFSEEIASLTTPDSMVVIRSRG